MNVSAGGDKAGPWVTKTDMNAVEDFCSIHHKSFFLPVFLSWVLSDAGDKIKIDNFPFAGISLDYHTTVINFLNDALYAAVI